MTTATSSEARSQSDEEDLLEVIAEKKRQFLIHRLSLTTEEEDRFFSLYDEFLLSTLRLNRQRAQNLEALRDEFNNGNNTSRMAALARQTGLYEERMAEVKRNFYQQFEDLLGERRFAALILAEIDFQQQIDLLRAEYQNRPERRRRSN